MEEGKKADMEQSSAKREPQVKPRVLGIDIETYSSVDLSKCGVYKYCESDDFEILLCAYALDDGEVEMVDLACGEQIPDWFFEYLEDPEVIKAAWNAQFERTCFSRYLGHQLSPVGWHCTMIHAATLSLPLSLKSAAEALQTGEQKDRAGEALIRKFSVPKMDKETGKVKRTYLKDDPEGWQKFKDYCVQDVRTERDIRVHLEQFPVPEQEWRYYEMDQRINDRGVQIDTELVNQAIACDLAISDAMTKRAYELTGLENPNSVSQLKQWLHERGIETESLGKNDVSALITEVSEDSTDQDVLEMLKLRLRMSKSSVKKYESAERAVCSDGRVRGTLQFYGANRTGRWCLAEGSPVLVKDAAGEIYEKPVEDVSVTDLVFDGDNWVRHEGVIFSGEKEVITWDGITATEDHEVYIDEFSSIPLGEAKERRLPIWRGKRKFSPSTG